MIGRSCGRLCDSGIAGRFLGSDAAAGAGLRRGGGRGLAVWWRAVWIAAGDGGVMALTDSCETGATIARWWCVRRKHDRT